MSVQPEVKTQDTNLPEQKVEAKPAEQSKEASQPIQETQEQINWRKFRQEREQQRKAKEDADRRAAEKEAEAAALKAAMEALVNKPSPQVSQEEKTEDQIIEEKVNAIIAKDRQRQERDRAEREAAELPNRLNQTYNDFNQVCTQENLDYLEYHYPEVARLARKVPNDFEKWSDLYKSIKRFVPNPQSAKDQAKIDRNLNKPQSMSIPGATQTGDQAPHELTEKRRQDNWARMQRTMKSTK